MLNAIALAVTLSGNFVHPNPTPSADLPVAVFQQRRARLMAELGGCAAIISSQGEARGETEDFRQDADFYWLTGINEPGAHLVLQPKSPYRKVQLFLKSRDPEAERWTGPRDPVSPELLVKYGVDRVLRHAREKTRAAPRPPDAQRERQGRPQHSQPQPRPQRPPPAAVHLVRTPRAPPRH